LFGIGRLISIVLCAVSFRPGPRSSLLLATTFIVRIIVILVVLIIFVFFLFLIWQRIRLWYLSQIGKFSLLGGYNACLDQFLEFGDKSIL
jgi:uncharacterized membrane protein